MKVLRDLVGMTLSNRYRLISRIAGGGMGDVYRGHDLLLDRKVAIKVLQPSLARDPELVQRFKQEARSAARLNHPNVVQVHDWGSESDDTYYMVMEYVSGKDLRDVLVGRGPLAPARAAEIVACICDALHASHQMGLVHRDVKPENVLIARDGVVKVTDFGIAALADAERSQPGGTILGTLRYLSPEQAAGEEATAASDLWAAGAVLFELLVGSALQGGSGADLLRRRALEAPEAPSRYSPSVPAEMDAIVLKACSLDPRMRFANAAEMARALRTLAPQEEPDEDLLVDLTGEVRLPDMQPTSFVARGDLKRQKKGRVRSRFRKLALLVVLLVALAAGGVQAGQAIFGPKEVRVPPVTGLTLADATARAESVGFKLEVTGEERDPQVPAGSVLDQTPADGLLLEGRPISVVVSAGLPLSKVPSLKGMGLDEALAELRAKNLTKGSVNEQFSRTVKVGTVIGQDPRKGRVEWGTKVYIVISKGPRSVGVPEVSGLSADKAEAVLRQAGFVAARVDSFSDEVPLGKVIYTTPGEGAVAPEGSEIQLFVSTGPEFKELTLPDVRGMAVDEAKSLMRGKGLAVSVQQSCPGSTVVDTVPSAGSTVKESSEVALFIC